jgi:hypothetical protein
MNRSLREALIIHHRQTSEALTRIEPNCRSCLHLGPALQCKKNDSQVIPDAFITTGCDAWEFDEIPF